MDNLYDEIDPIEIDTIEEELPTKEDFESTEVEEDDEDIQFPDIIKELRFQLKFSESVRKRIKIKIGKKSYKVIPIAEFKSGTFVLKADNGEIIKVKKSEIAK